MRYKTEYLPAALRDLTEIARYVSEELKSPQAAERLAEELVEAAEKAAAFPYASPVHIPIRPLRREYRKILARGYFVFYFVDEARKTATVARFIYARRNCGRIIL